MQTDITPRSWDPKFVSGLLIGTTNVPKIPAGIFGTLVVPMSNPDTNFGSQLLGVISVCIFSFVLSYIVFKALKETIGLRISKEAEKLGTDKAEVGVVAYSIRD